LPAKIQRTLSQEFMRSQQQQTQAAEPQYGQFQYEAPQTAAPPPAAPAPAASQQYPGQHPGQQVQQSPKTGASNASVEVPTATKCAICGLTNVDTQLRPCGHMFHEKCLKPNLRAPVGQSPRCPVDHIPMQSAILAIPTDEVRPYEKLLFVHGTRFLSNSFFLLQNAKPRPIPVPMQPQPATWSAPPAVPTDSQR